MSYSEVVAILGKEGTELSRVSVGDRKLETVMYSWQRRFSGANILVTFQGGQVEMKAQAGLD
jgi:hypothetical protein